MQNARVHCRGEESIASLPTIRSHTTHTISQTLKNLHVESCVDSLTLRCEFVVHNTNAVKKKTQQHDSDLLFRDFFGLGDSLCFHSLLCDFSSMS